MEGIFNDEQIQQFIKEKNLKNISDIQNALKENCSGIPSRSF